MSAAEFAERLAESAKIIKYTFRMEIPKEEQDLQDNLVACSLDQAYRMAKPLFLDRWKNHPFLRNPEFKQESNQQVKSESGSEAKLNSDQQAKLNSDQMDFIALEKEGKVSSVVVRLSINSSFDPKLISSIGKFGACWRAAAITSAPLKRPGSIKSLISAPISVEAASICSAASPFSASSVR